MAKNGKKSAALVSPMYEGGRMNGPVAGPRGGVSPADPCNYLGKSGASAPSGSPADRGQNATDAPSSHHGR